MAGRWDQKNLPHKGWTCIDSADLGEGNFQSCEMCGQEKIRYVHFMQHPSVDACLEVGCVCATKMSDDYEGPKRREKLLKNKATRKAKWLSRKWRTSERGNPYLNIEGKNIGVHPVGKRWSHRIGQTYSKTKYATSDEAKLALFEEFWRVQQARPKS